MIYNFYSLSKSIKKLRAQGCAPRASLDATRRYRVVQLKAKSYEQITFRFHTSIQQRRTFEWALLEATRKVAIQADLRKRTSLAQPDRVCTLFFWGFGIDEKLEERLLFHKQNCSQPDNILNFPLNLKNDFEEKAFELAIQNLNPEVKYKIVPEGREIKETMPESIADAAKNLASGLIPLADKYPMPFYRMEEKAV